MEPEILPTHNRATRSVRFFNQVHRYSGLLRRRWWVLLIALLLGLVIRGVMIFTATPLYRSIGQMTVSVKVQIPTTSVYSEEVSQFLGTQVAYMRSATVRLRAADRVRTLKPDLPATPVTLDISVLPRTTIFNLEAVGASPEYTRAYLDAVMEEYIQFKKDMRESTSDYTLTGITEQLASLERELKKSENELLAFQQSNSVVFLQEQGNSAGAYLAQLNRQLASLKSDYKLLSLLDLDQNLELQQDAEAAAATSSNDARDPLLATPLQSGYLRAKQNIQMLKAELQDWSQYLKPRHPRIVKLRDDIARQEKLLEIYRQQSLDQLENRRDSLSLQIENLQKEIKEWEVKSLDVSRKMAEYDRIRANKQRLQALYDRLLAAMQTLGVDKNIAPESVAIMQRATPAAPARQSAVKQLIIAAAIGLIAGLAILLLLDRFDDRLASLVELHDIFDEPILGQIPMQSTEGSREGLELLRPDDPRHSFFEAYRNLRSSLLYMATEGKRPKTILVTSAIPSDGKSITTANLAITLAIGGAQVLLVDGDMRKGSLHRRFGLEPAPGLTEILSGNADWEQAAQTTNIVNLFLLPRGSVTRNPGELFLTKASPELLKALGNKFDFVIIDSAPVMAADDVTSLAPQVEGVAFVIRANYTSARVARAALDLLYQREVEVLGLVFNCVQSDASDYYYYKYKDYYADQPSA